MNMNNLMAQAQKMQKDIEKKQNELYSMNFEGNSQLVDIVLNGKKEVQKVTIKNKDSFDTEDLEILEDMIKIAMSDAITKIEKETNSKLGMYGKSLGGLM